MNDTYEKLAKCASKLNELAEEYKIAKIETFEKKYFLPGNVQILITPDYEKKATQTDIVSFEEAVKNLLQPEIVTLHTRESIELRVETNQLSKERQQKILDSAEELGSFLKKNVRK